MVGQHGWSVFFASVLGYDDSQIAYTGTVSPIEKVPNYEKWSLYGGSSAEHTYQEVPQDLLVNIPPYNSNEQKMTDSTRLVYSIGHMGSYETGAEHSGSHPGVDIRVPVGTPVRSIGNGIVTVAKDNSSFGKLVVVKHPNVPDPDEPSRQTTLYSVYAHLSSILVKEGDVVSKAQRIALSGKTGFATGPHLHFQIDRDTAPWHPYWPFTDSEAKALNMNFTAAVNSTTFQSRGLEMTINPMLYVQANYAAATIAGSKDPVVVAPVVTPPKQTGSTSSRASIVDRVRDARAKRLTARLERQRFSDRSSNIVAVSNQTPIVTTPVIIQKDPVTPAQTGIIPVSAEFSHDQQFNRGWEKVRITLLDSTGKKILNPDLSAGFYLRTAYGEAEFRPDILKPTDFIDGEAVVNMLPSGNRTIVIKLDPLGVLSKPFEYQK